jgi:hypothetical protein
MEIVMELAGVDKDTAEKALQEHGDVVSAVDALLSKPKVAGDKYIPTKPKTNTDMTDEQKERCERGRWLQDQVNAVFSVAHSKVRNQPDHEALQDAVSHDSTATAELPTTPPSQ